MESVTKDLMEMKVTELRDELEARGAGRSGNKPQLRRALHAIIVKSHLTGDDG